MGQDEALFKCRLLLIEDPALKLSPSSMWWCRSLSFVESDAVNRSTCMDILCSGVCISQTMYAEADYPYPAACNKRPLWGSREGSGYVAVLISRLCMLTLRRQGLCSGIHFPHYGDPEKAGVMKPYSISPTMGTPRRQGLQGYVAVYISPHYGDLEKAGAM